MAPKAKPTPHRLGPPPQLNSLKVPVVHQKFAKKSSTKVARSCVSSHQDPCKMVPHSVFLEKIPHVLDGASDCEQNGASDAHLSVLHTHISRLTGDIPWRVDYCLLLPDHHRHGDGVAECELLAGWLPPGHHRASHSSHSE